MARNYKPRQGGRSGSGLLLGIFIGFMLGVVVAAGVALYITKAPVPFLDRGRTDRPAPSATQNLKDVPKSAAKTPDGKPRFDFYRILPGQEEPVTNEQLKQAATKDKGTKAESELKDNYFLQAGAFQSPADADNMKAKLAFMGLESSVEPTNIPEKGVFYRVRLGPYTKIDDINRVRSQLAQNGVDASLVKVRDARNP